MRAIDFAHSYMTWTNPNRGNSARIQIDAACTIVTPQTGESETFYLIAPCRSEHVAPGGKLFGEGRLFSMPINYEYCGIWSRQDAVILRTHSLSEHTSRQYAVNERTWKQVRLDIRHHPVTRALEDQETIVRATFDNLTLIARTELHDEATGLRAVLKYPIKTMNVAEAPAGYQVDTGPLLVPDFTATSEHTIERFDVAHVVYNRADIAEFILRRPTPLAEGDDPKRQTVDYSVVQILAAQNTLFAGTAE